MSRRNLSLQRRCAWWLNKGTAPRAGEVVLEVQALEYARDEEARTSDGGRDRQTSGGKHA